MGELGRHSTMDLYNLLEDYFVDNEDAVRILKTTKLTAKWGHYQKFFKNKNYEFLLCSSLNLQFIPRRFGC